MLCAKKKSNKQTNKINRNNKNRLNYMNPSRKKNESGINDRKDSGSQPGQTVETTRGRVGDKKEAKHRQKAEKNVFFVT